MTSVPVPGEAQPMGTTGGHLAVLMGAPRGGCWGSLWELPSPGWLMVASCPSWGAGGAGWTGRCQHLSWRPALVAHGTHLTTRWHRRAPKGPSQHPPRLQQDPSSAPGLEGLILTTIISAWPCWAHPGTHLLLLVLPNPLWHPSSLLCPPGPIVHQLLLLLLDSSWNSLSPPLSPGPILVPIISSWSHPTHLGAPHLCLALLDPSWHLSCLSGPAGTILAFIMSSWFSWNHPAAHHLCLMLPKTSWCPSSPPAPVAPILVPIISALSC